MAIPGAAGGVGKDFRALAIMLPVIIAFALLSCARAYGEEFRRLSSKTGAASARIMVFLHAAIGTLALSGVASLVFMKGAPTGAVIIFLVSGAMLSGLGILFTFIFRSITSYMGFAMAISFAAMVLLLQSIF